LLKIGFATHRFVADEQRPLYDQIEETVELVAQLARWGTFDNIRAQHHWLSHPTIWIEPFPLLARLAAVSGHMQLSTSILKLALHNPVELAHQVATLDQMCNGRFVLGIGTGYQQEELAAVGATRAERAARLEECLELMKALWTGEEVTHNGKYWTVDNVRMGYTPVQKPYPLVWCAAQSSRATRRAARSCDGILIAPQIGWDAVARFADEYRAALAEFGKTHGMVGVHRNMSVAPSYEDADRAARRSVAAAAKYYGPWRMQERTMPQLVLSPEDDPDNWAIIGTPSQCVEKLLGLQERIGFEYIGLDFANLPGDPSARRDYLQWVSEEVLSKVR
jgi:alkanesulfonate monooxygenase SsuD/methylene tetrahydromethanopterin reductase-like flavin-dependent oxidoreductase (luciferase family)